jgi:methionine-rich copper-binding protein CopC
MPRQCGRAGALVAFVVLCFAGSAQAHTHLKTSSPAAGATLATTPTEIRLQFHEAIEASVSHVSVETNAGQAVADGAAARDPSDKTTLVLQLAEPLKPGAYKVTWRVISADTHKVKGSFTFQVRP